MKNQDEKKFSDWFPKQFNDNDMKKFKEKLELIKKKSLNTFLII